MIAQTPTSPIEPGPVPPDGQPFSSLLEARQRADRLAARLRELGIDPEAIDP